jgi:hypothetical protein
MANGTTAAIDELLKILSQLRKGHEQTFSRLAELEQDMEAIETTLRYLKARQPAEIQAAIDPNELRSMTQIKALIAVAKSNNGDLKVTEAKRLMLQAGLFQNSKNASQIIYNVIKRSDVFVKVRPGIYRLKSVQPRLPQPRGYRRP